MSLIADWIAERVLANPSRVSAEELIQRYGDEDPAHLKRLVEESVSNLARQGEQSFL